MWSEVTLSPLPVLAGTKSLLLLKLPALGTSMRLKVKEGTPHPYWCLCPFSLLVVLVIDSVSVIFCKCVVSTALAAILLLSCEKLFPTVHSDDINTLSHEGLTLLLVLVTETAGIDRGSLREKNNKKEHTKKFFSPFSSLSSSLGVPKHATFVKLPWDIWVAGGGAVHEEC